MGSPFSVNGLAEEMAGEQSTVLASASHHASGRRVFRSAATRAVQRVAKGGPERESTRRVMWRVQYARTVGGCGEVVSSSGSLGMSRDMDVGGLEGEVFGGGDGEGKRG